MTVINGSDLLARQPIEIMLSTKIRSHGVSHGLGEAGYDIRIKQTVRFKPSLFGLVMRVQLYDEPFRLGRFTTASAIGRFQMPDNLVGIVHDKSTWARKGLSVFNTVIEPGWTGYLTLELVYHGTEPLEIPAGAGIAQVIFHQTSTQANYTGKYQNQPNRPVAAIMESS